MELEAEVAKLQEENEQLQKKQAEIMEVQKNQVRCFTFTPQILNIIFDIRQWSRMFRLNSLLRIDFPLDEAGSFHQDPFFDIFLQILFPLAQVFCHFIHPYRNLASVQWSWNVRFRSLLILFSNFPKIEFSLH